MTPKLRAHLNYANVVSSLCLFIVLGGGAYAAVNLPKDSVKSRHIDNGQVRNPDLGTDAVTSRKVDDFSLLATDFRPGQLPKGDTGEKGETGETGPEGGRGPQGPPGPTAAGVDDVSTPSSTPTATVREATITTTQPGKIFGLVIPTGTWGVTCNASCSVSWGLYVDGAPMQGNTLGSSFTTAGSHTSSFTLALMAKSTTAVPAGNHTVALKYTQSGGVTGVNGGSPRVGAIALGE